MEFIDKHMVEIIIVGIWLCAVYRIGKINSAKEKAELAVAELSSKENWSSVQDIIIRRQINIDTTLERVEIGISIIVVVLIFMLFK